MDYSIGTILVIAILIGSATYWLYRMFGFGTNQFPVNGKTILITGASEGLGKAIAVQLAQKGASVVIVSRSPVKLQAAIAEVQAAALDLSKQRFHYISADLTSADAADRILDETTTWNNGIAPDVVWCCAGFSHPGLFIDLPIQTLRDQMDTVYWTAAHTAHATLRRWLVPVAQENKSKDQAPPRHLIFTSSTLGFFTVSGYSSYSPAKAAMKSLSDTLAQEVELYNGVRRKQDANAPAADVKVHIVFPMGMTSPGFQNEQKLKPEITHIVEEADKPQLPEEVATIAIKGLERGDFHIVTNFVGQVMRASALGSSPRNNMLLDTAWSWLSSVVMLFIISDFVKKAYNYGKQKGMPSATAQM